MADGKKSLRLAERVTELGFFLEAHGAAETGIVFVAKAAARTALSCVLMLCSRWPSRLV